MPGKAPAEPSRHRVERVMGTVVSLRLRDRAPVALLDRVVAWLHRVDRIFSTYRDDSQISRLASWELALDRCDRDVRLVLEVCERLRQASRGYFDAWAAGPGLLDPSGVVKGWSVEVASGLLVAEGFDHHLINAGGDVQARGEREPGRPWRIGVRDPPAATGSPLAPGRRAATRSLRSGRRPVTLHDRPLGKLS